MIDLDQAYSILFSTVSVGPTVEVRLNDAQDRTLARPVMCDVDYPPFDRAVMDGFAVRSVDVADAPTTLRVVGRAPAGAVATCKVGSGEAIEINTGAPMPQGADAVVRIEETDAGANIKASPCVDGDLCETVEIRSSVATGCFVTPRAKYVRAGDLVLDVGHRLGATAIAAAATAGAARVTVYRQPQVAVLATGDELIPVEQVPTGAQIRNSNHLLIEGLIETAGGRAIGLGVARDDREQLRTKILEGLQSDVLCISGGISMGSRDFVPEVLEECGATVQIRKVAIKPGRPTLFATTADGTLIFALPGNPASAFVSFVLFVQPALAVLQGQGESMPPLVTATLLGRISATSNRRTFIPVRAFLDEGGWKCEPTSWHGSGDPFGLASANALVNRPTNSPAVESGDRVSVLVPGLSVADIKTSEARS